MIKLGTKVMKTPQEMGLVKDTTEVEVPGKMGIKAKLWLDPQTKAPFIFMDGGCYPVIEEFEDEPINQEIMLKKETKVEQPNTVTETKFEKPSPTTALSRITQPTQELGMVIDVDKAEEQWKNYLELTKRILVEEDYQTIGAKKFKKKSAWRKYARFFNITDKIIDERITRDEKGNVIEAVYLVEAQFPNGRTSQGLGMANRVERNKMFNKDHDLVTTAHTRAKSRAISDLIGAGEVSAEEVDG